MSGTVYRRGFSHRRAASRCRSRRRRRAGANARLCGHRRRPRPDRCRPPGRPAPPAGQDAGLCRRPDRDEGSGYGGRAGYSTELLARTVGPTGTVYAQDSAAVIERFVKDKFDIRAQKPAMKNVVHVVRNFDDPIPPDVSNLDLITFFFAYHDITYMEVDRAAMNKKMFAALKPGGFLDHRRPLRQAGRRRQRRQDAAPDRGEHAEAGDRGRRLQAGRGSRFPAPSRRSPGPESVSAGGAERRVRAEIPEAQS